MVLHSSGNLVVGEGHKQKDREASGEGVALEEVPSARARVPD